MCKENNVNSVKLTKEEMLIMRQQAKAEKARIKEEKRLQKAREKEIKKQRKQAEKLIKQDAKAKAKVEKKVRKEIAKAHIAPNHEMFEDDIRILTKYVNEYTVRKQQKEQKVVEQSRYLVLKETLAYLNGYLNKIISHKNSFEESSKEAMDFLFNK